jgi:hypothetical protein
MPSTPLPLAPHADAPLVFAICGPAGSGKTTLARALCEKYNFTRLPFAAPIKQMLRGLLEFQGVSTHQIDRMLYGDLKEISTKYLAERTPRHAMQTLGTEWRDLIARDLWTNIWVTAAQSAHPSTRTRGVIADDLRFLHEADAIRALGGKIIRIHRPGFGADAHISEHEYLTIRPNTTLTNSSTPEFLFHKARLLLADALHADAPESTS